MDIGLDVNDAFSLAPRSLRACGQRVSQNDERHSLSFGACAQRFDPDMGTPPLQFPDKGCEKRSSDNKHPDFFDDSRSVREDIFMSSSIAYQRSTDPAKPMTGLALKLSCTAQSLRDCLRG
jgi:hypothetical protein